MTNREAKKAHLKTIRVHRKAVRRACFKMGIIWQGLVHDLSKYSRTEMQIYKWYSGNRSPHDNARDELGYSPSWYHHKNMNKHHWEYWLDFNGAVTIDGELYIKPLPIKMPYKYVIEMFCDFVGAGKAYSKVKWNTKMPFEYYEKACKGQRIMHKESEELFVVLLEKMANCQTEHEFYSWYKKNKNQLKEFYKGGKIYEIRHQSFDR